MVRLSLSTSAVDVEEGVRRLVQEVQERSRETSEASTSP
jgi:hypothetical protein